MNKNTLKQDAKQKELIESALAAWCELLERGEEINREDFLNQYDAVLRDELSQCLQAFDFIQSAIPQQRDPASVSNVTGDHDPSFFGLPFRLGDFEVLEEIGRGGMGVVYRAMQVSLDRPVAVKILPFAALLDGRQLDRFRNEVRAAAMLKHPHIVSVISVGYERGLHYYAMELVGGCSLANVIGATPNSKKKITPTQDTTPIASLSTRGFGDRMTFFKSVARIGMQAGSGLQAAHEAGVVHRDIKPSNLLLDHDGRVLIADFGLARVQKEQGVTMTGDLLGTLRYISPEQLQDSQSADQRSDVYSLGLTMFELIAGKPAFQSMEKATVVTEISEGKIPSLRKVVSDIPRDIETVIAKSVSLAPQSRYQTAAEMVADLERFVAGKPVLARKPRALESLTRWANRNRAKAALCAIATATLLVAAVGGPVIAVQQARESQRQSVLAAKREHEAYVADMRRAQRHLEHGETDQAIRLLSNYIPQADGDVDYRNFEWRYLTAECERPQTFQTIAISRVFKACDLSKDERWLAAGSRSGSVAVFDARTGKLKWKSTKATSHKADIHDLCFSSNGKLLFTGGLDRRIKIFEVATGKQLVSQSFAAAPRAIATSGNKLVVCFNSGGPHAEGSNAQTKLQLFEIQASPAAKLNSPIATANNLPYITSLEISPDSQSVAGSCDDGVVRLWDSSSLELVKSGSLNAHETITSTSFSKDGKSLVVGSAYRESRRLPANAYVLDVKNFNTTATFPHPTEIRDAKFTEEQTCITASRAGIVREWSLSDGKLLDQWAASSNRINELRLANDGTLFLACQAKKLLRISPPSDANTVMAGGFSGGMDLAFNPDSSKVACATSSGQLRIYDTATSRLLDTTDPASERLWATSYSHDGKYLAATASPRPVNKEIESELIIFDATTGKKLHKTEIPEIHYARSIQFSPKENKLAIGGSGKLVFFDVNKQLFSAPTDVGGHTQVFYVDFSGDGRFVGCISSWGRGGVRIWRYPSMEEVLYRPVNRRPFIWGFALDSKGARYAVADHKNADYAVSIRNLPGGDHAFSLVGHTDYVTSIDFSPDDRRLLTSGKDGQVILWNLETGQELVRFREHSSWVWRARFSPDGSMVASVQDSTDPAVVLRRTLSIDESETILRSPIESSVFVENIPTVGSY